MVENSFVIVYLVILLASIVLPLVIPARFKKYVWILPALIALVLIVYTASISVHDIDGGLSILIMQLFIFPPVLFLLLYYTKVLSCATKGLPPSRKIALWSIVAFSLAALIGLYLFLMIYR